MNKLGALISLIIVYEAARILLINAWNLLKKLPQKIISTYFKIRNWMQKNKNSWEYSGICTVINGNGEIITNTKPVSITFGNQKK